MVQWPFRTAGINASSPPAPALAPTHRGGSLLLANPPQTNPRGHAPLGGYVGVKVGHLIENSRLVRVTQGGGAGTLFGPL